MVSGVLQPDKISYCQKKGILDENWTLESPGSKIGVLPKLASRTIKKNTKVNIDKVILAELAKI